MILKKYFFNDKIILKTIKIKYLFKREKESKIIKIRWEKTMDLNEITIDKNITITDI